MNESLYASLAGFTEAFSTLATSNGPLWAGLGVGVYHFGSVLAEMFAKERRQRERAFKRARLGPSNASRATLMRRACLYSNRKGRSAARRLGARVIRGAPRNGPLCARCALPTSIEHPLLCPSDGFACVPRREESAA